MSDQNLMRELPYFLGIAYNLLGNVPDSEDAVQEVFLKFFRKKPQVNKAALKSYLSKMVVNYCLDQLKRPRRNVSLEVVGDPCRSEAQPEPDYELQQWLQELEPKDRLVLDLFYREELSIEAISDIMDITSGAVKVRLHRARKRLREIARQQGVNCADI